MATETASSAWYRLTVPFWNETERRLRAFWRLVGALVAVFSLSGLLLSQVGLSDDPLAMRGLFSQVVFSGVTVLTLVVWARYVDRRPLAEYGFRFDRRWLGELTLGIGVGVVCWGGALVTNVAFDWAQIDGYLAAGPTFPFVVGFGVYALQFALVAFWEETVFRGLLMRNAIEGFRVKWLSERGAVAAGVLVSSLVFAAGHGSQAESILALGFWLGTGVLLGLTYLYTDELAVPIGLHFAFDFAVNNVFGISNVRPLGAKIPSLVAPSFTGPDRFVEVAGLVNTVWVAVAGVVLLALLSRFGGSLRVRIGRYERP